MDYENSFSLVDMSHPLVDPLVRLLVLLEMYISASYYTSADYARYLTKSDLTGIDYSDFSENSFLVASVRCEDSHNCPF